MLTSLTGTTILAAAPAARIVAASQSAASQHSLPWTVVMALAVSVGLALIGAAYQQIGWALRVLRQLSSKRTHSAFARVWAAAARRKHARVFRGTPPTARRRTDFGASRSRRSSASGGRVALARASVGARGQSVVTGVGAARQRALRPHPGGHSVVSYISLGMRRVALFSLLLIAGLVLSQGISGLGAHASTATLVIKLLTMTALAFIMIHVGLEFEIDKDRLRSYGWDYVVAMTAATFPWLLVSGYFLLCVLPDGAIGSWAAWREALLASRFAAPTSAGLLFAMLAAAGLGGTWVFRKARLLAIFDDLDTVVLMIPLKILIVGLAWQMGVTLGIMLVQLWIAWRWLHSIDLPRTWPWMLVYSAALMGVCEAIHLGGKIIDDTVPIYLEVLLPAFVLGCVMKPDGEAAAPRERVVATTVSACFMLLVGLSMPAITETGPTNGAASSVSAGQEVLGWGSLILHTLAVTALSNVGKLFPLACYRREASVRERMALAVAMWPRGEVGAGVLVISVSYGLGGAMITVATLSLALNLLLTGPFILLVKRLLAQADRRYLES